MLTRRTQWSCTVNLGFYGMFSVKVGVIPNEPDAPVDAWIYRVYEHGSDDFIGWGRKSLVVTWKDLEVV
jgi:hypothetical protein